MKDKLKAIIEKYNNLSEQMADQAILSDQNKLTAIAKEHRSLEDIVKVGENYININNQIDDVNEMLKENDREFQQIAQEELVDLQAKKEKLEEKIKVLLLPKDPNDNKNLILEIRAGTGGDEAALFASDLFRIYIRYVERKNW